MSVRICLYISLPVPASQFHMVQEIGMEYYPVQVQKWFSSYLKNMLQSVRIKDPLSDKVTLSYGVPQGSVLGPLRFT